MSNNENSISNNDKIKIENSGDNNNDLKTENENLNIEIKKLYGIITKLKSQILSDKNNTNLEQKEEEIKILNQKINDNNAIIEQYKSKIISYENEIKILNDQINLLTNNEKNKKETKRFKSYSLNELIIVKKISLMVTSCIAEKSFFVTGEENSKIINQSIRKESKDIINLDIINKKNNELKNMINLNKKVNEELMKYINLTNKYKNEINNMKAEKNSLEDLIIKQEEKINYFSKTIIEKNKEMNINFTKNKVYIANLEETLKNLYKELSSLKKQKNNSKKKNEQLNISNFEKDILSANNSPKNRKVYFFNMNNNKNVLSFNKIKNTFSEKNNSYKQDYNRNINSSNLRNIHSIKRPIIKYKMHNYNIFKQINDINKNESIENDYKKKINNMSGLENEKKYIHKKAKKNVNVNKKALYRGKSSIMLFKKNIEIDHNEQQDKKNIDELKSMFEQIIDDINKN